ncbi:heavy-metal-associated domain-containing protein [Paucisalibacillus globulus]|uniref:heavy-metal-associated domain-containing protein n=1 Tax=Paucisalibacillus globulus TaxID=351095 RepID=UPI0003F61639|nr:heavy metal-associated domain-containing protein [Paucisalibacillus globulus]
MATKKFQLEPLTCPSCIKKIETKLSKMDGVDEAKVMFNSSKVKTTFNEELVTADELKDTIEKLGYQVIA